MYTANRIDAAEAHRIGLVTAFREKRQPQFVGH
jgi:enoyl-CoA hydratase/carnithine racemase